MQTNNGLVARLNDAASALSAWQVKYDLALQAIKAPEAASRFVQHASDLKGKVEEFIPPIVSKGLEAVQKKVPGIVATSVNSIITEANVAADKAVQLLTELFGSLEAIPQQFKENLPTKLEPVKEEAPAA
jgi:heterodisulfide reductase subunit A-like polyferredoxin